MTYALPAFDVDALRQVADMYPTPPADPAELERQWRTLVQDLQAAADRIDELTFVLAQGRAA